MTTAADIRVSLLPTARRRPPAGGSNGGSTIVVVLLVIAVLSVVAGGVLFSATSRYHSTYQSASWQEALVGAEAGVDLAMTELRKMVIDGAKPFNNWAKKDGADKAYPDEGRAFPSNNPRAPFIMRSVHGGEGASVLGFRVYVDVPGVDTPSLPNVSFEQTIPSNVDPFINERRDGDKPDPARRWYRIRSLGYAGVSGPPRANLDPRDNRLRKFSFVSDWRTGLPVSPSTGPNVSRLVEVVAKPLTTFRNALMADREHDNVKGSIDLGNKNVLIDSYDSSKGDYDEVNNQGSLANLATNGLLINANNAEVRGDAMTNNGAVTGANQVSGQQRADYYQELSKVEYPDDVQWTKLNPYTLDASTTSDQVASSGGQLLPDGNVTYTASKNPKNPTRIRLNAIDLTRGTRSISVVAPADADPKTPTYIKILVDGPITTSGSNAIRLSENVNAIIYVTGDVKMEGYGIFNNSYRPSQLLINGISPPESGGKTPTRSFYVGTTQDFQGIIYAPSHDLTLALQGLKDDDTLANQIQKKQNDITSYQDRYDERMRQYQQKMDDYKLTANPNSLKEANQKLADAQEAQVNKATAEQELVFLQGRRVTEMEDRARGYNGIYGAFVGRTINVLSNTHLHYDESLRRAGPINHYEIVNWFEDQSSRATVTW